MNILFVEQFSELGGAQRCLLDLLPGLTERGWGCHVMLPGSGPLLDGLKEQRVGVTAIPEGPRGLARLAWDAARQAHSIRAVLKSRRFDLVYVNGPRLLPAAAWAAGAGPPLFFHAHNRLNRAHHVLAAGWSLRRSRATVAACSAFVGEPLLPYVASGRLHIVPNGTPDMGFRDRRFEPGHWRIGFIGRLSSEKGLPEFLEAAASVSGARFVVCGAPQWSDARHARELREGAHGLPVDFLGWREDIASVLSGLDLLVIPSRQEGLPRVMLEAFSAGVPVVAFPAGGVVEAIDDNETGFLVPQFSARALADRLRGLAAGDPEFLRQVARNARQRWEERYTVTRYRQRMLALVEAAANGTAPPRGRT